MTYIDPGAKLLGHLDRLTELQTTGRTSAPISLEVDLSNRCSLGCSWCHFSSTHTRGPLAGKTPQRRDKVPGGDLMDTALALDLIDQAADFGVRSLTITGGGEPTLHKDFDLIAAYTEDKIPLGLYTHGGHLDKTRAELLKRVATFVYVSLDAVEHAAYKRLKGVDRFEAACAGIRRLARAEGQAAVGMGMLVGPETSRAEMERSPLLAAELGADYVQYRPIVAFDVREPSVRADDVLWVDSALDCLDRVAAEFTNVELDRTRFLHYRDWVGHGYRSCSWSMLQTCVTPDGSVWACVNRREFAGSKLGNLFEESFADIWSRHTATKVDGDCRVSCRGHVANLALEEILAPAPHAAFV